MKGFLILMAAGLFSVGAYGQTNEENIQKMLIGTWIEKYDSGTTYKVCFYKDSIIFYEINSIVKESIHITKYEYSLQTISEMQCGYGKYKRGEDHTNYSLQIHEYFPVDEDYGDCIPIYSISKANIKINNFSGDNLPALILKK